MVGACPFRFIVPLRVTLLFGCWWPRLKTVPVAVKRVGRAIVTLAVAEDASPIVPLSDKAPAEEFVPSEVALFTKIVPPESAHVSEAALALFRISEPAPVFVI